MPQLGLVILLVAELVYLTVRFDSQALDRASSPWLHLVAWSPQYLRLAITVAVTALVLKTWRLAGPAAARAPARPSARITWLAVHVAALLLFVRITATVFDPALADRNAGMWVTAWFVLGAATLAAWALALWPRRISWLESKSVRAFAGIAAALGGAAWLSGYIAEALWQPLARTTFRVVGAMLGVIYPQVVSQPDRLRLGTPGFTVSDRARVLGVRRHRAAAGVPRRLPLGVSPRAALPRRAGAPADRRGDDVGRQRAAHRRAHRDRHGRLARDRARRLPFPGRLDCLQRDRARLRRRC